MNRLVFCRFLSTETVVQLAVIIRHCSYYRYFSRFLMLSNHVEWINMDNAITYWISRFKYSIVEMR